MAISQSCNLTSLSDERKTRTLLKILCTCSCSGSEGGEPPSSYYLLWKLLNGQLRATDTACERPPEHISHARYNCCKEVKETFSETGKPFERKMENPLLLFPQLNISASKDKSYYKVMKSTIKEEPHKASKPGAKQKRNRLSLLLQKPEFHEGDHLAKPENLTKAASRVSPEEAVKWGESFDKLLSEKAGLDAFTKFLKTEFSEENIEFWIACEDYKKSKTAHELLPKAKTIYETFIQKDAPKEVNLDFQTKEVTSQNIGHPIITTFDRAQNTVYKLMEQDSYPRFLRSDPYLSLVKGRSPSRPTLRRRSRSFTVNDFKGVRPDFTVW